MKKIVAGLALGVALTAGVVANAWFPTEARMADEQWLQTEAKSAQVDEQWLQTEVRSAQVDEHLLPVEARTA